MIRRALVALAGGSLVFGVMALAMGLVRFDSEPASPRAGAEATRQAAEADLTALAASVRKFSETTGACPETITDLFTEGYDGSALDPWGELYEIHCPPDEPVWVRSFGPDSLPDTDDDLVVSRGR